MSEGVEKKSGALRIIDGGKLLDDTRGGGPGGPGTAPPGDGEGDGPDIKPIWCSDDGLAAALSSDLGEDWRHVAASGNWYEWDGKAWRCEVTKLIFHRSRHICRRVASEIADFKLSKAVASDHAIYAAVKIAGTDRKHATVITEFDANPWLLNTPGGIVDLRTGQIEGHDPAAMMTKLTAAAPAGDCPRWEQFLRDATGKGLAMIEYLARVAGYCLTGSVEERAIFFLYGPTRTGKSVFQSVLSMLLGDYAASAPMDVFTVATGERHPTELAHLAGARLVTASETEEGRRWDEAKLKHLSGRDTITARFSRGDFFDFAPTFKLLFAGNHRPRMRSADDAMRDRFHMIPFKHRADPPDKELIDKLQAELGGILKWAVRGEIERRRLGGLRPPKIVVEATDKYFEDEDTLGRWIGERCIVASAGENSTAAEIARRREAFTATADLYRDYKSWASRVGEFIPAQKVLTAKLERLAEAGGEFRYERTKAARGFRGLALKSNPGDLPLDSPAAERSREVGGLAERPELGEYLPGHDDPAEDWPRE